MRKPPRAEREGVGQHVRRRERVARGLEDHGLQVARRNEAHAVTQANGYNAAAARKSNDGRAHVDALAEVVVCLEREQLDDVLRVSSRLCRHTGRSASTKARTGRAAAYMSGWSAGAVGIKVWLTDAGRGGRENLATQDSHRQSQGRNLDHFLA